MALRENGGAVLSLSNGFHFFDFETGEATLVADLESGSPRIRLNDGKVDRRGRFVAGSMDRQELEPLGSVYQLSADRKVSILDRNIVVSNAPCWSPDGRTFYFADLIRGEIYAYDYDLETGSASRRRLFASTADDPGARTAARSTRKATYGTRRSSAVESSAMHRTGASTARSNFRSRP